MKDLINKFRASRAVKSNWIAGIKELIKAEWYKLYCSKLFLIILTSVAIYSAIQVGLVYFVHSSDMTAQQDAHLSDMFNFEPLGQNGILMIGNASLILSICIAAFSSLFVASEFQQNTIRAALALGKKRIYVYLSKLIVLCIAVVLFVIASAAVSTAGLTLLYGFGEVPILEYVRQVLSVFSTQMKLYCTFASVFCMIAFLCRNVGVTVVLNVAYALLTSILMSFLASFDALAFIVKGFPQYYIMVLNQSNDLSFYVTATVVSLFYIIVPCIIGLYVFQRTDIK
ncbi:MAG: ABC transporter permease [Tannerellaceae bacterium]|jgi:ABC-2 type transport system permease protein|nr:ABC transporter permease [Tannerellaceae bacterium]